MRRFLPVFFLLFLIANFWFYIDPSWAAPPIVIAQNIQCKPNGTTLEMKKCATDQYAVADKKLNQNYQTLIAQLSPERKQRLIEAQRAWISFRDKTCRFESSEVLGGSAESLFLTTCLTKVTQQRVQDFQNYLAQIK